MASMTKEEILVLLQSQVLMLKNKALETDLRMQKDWSAKNQVLQEAIKGLSTCDTLWLDGQYQSFFQREIKSYLRS